MSIVSKVSLFASSAASAIPANTKPRLLPLDFLRGIAVLLIIARHWDITNNAGSLFPLANAWQHVGWMGVDLFFVLSGFLVGGLLFVEYKKRDHIDVRRFIIRRGFKIWPSYYVYLAFVALRLRQRTHLSGTDLLYTLTPNLLHIQNYVAPISTPSGVDLVTIGTPLVHTWTLAIEEHFYLFLPLVLWALIRKGHISLGRGFAWLSALILIGCLAGRCAWYLHHPAQSAYTHLRMDSLFMGVAMAYLYHLHPERIRILTARPALLLVIGGLLLLPEAFLLVDSRFVATLGFSLVAAGFGCMVLASVSVSMTEGKGAAFFHSPISRFIAFMGTYSYTIYLWHMTFGQTLPKWFLNHHWLSSHAELHWVITTALYIIGSTMAGVVLGRLVEFPALALRDRIFPSRSGAPIM